MKKLLCLFFVFGIIFSAVKAETNPAIQENLGLAQKFMTAEKYSEALKSYQSILTLEAQNKLALQGISDCELMLQPVYLAQITPPPGGFAGPEYETAYQAYNEANTPWKKRKARIEINRVEVKLSRGIFEKDEQGYRVKVDNVLASARQKLDRKQDAQKVYLETRDNLLVLQKELDDRWGVGALQMFEAAVKELQNYYRGKNLPIPLGIISISAVDAGHGPVRLGDLRKISLKIENRYSEPVILLKAVSDNLLDESYSWQMMMLGGLKAEKDRYLFNTLGESYTPRIFNRGWLMPGESQFVEFDTRINNKKKKIMVGFAVVGRKTLSQIFLPVSAADPEVVIYRPASREAFKTVGNSPVIFIEKGVELLVQDVMLDYAPEPRAFSKEQAQKKIDHASSTEFLYCETFGSWVMLNTKTKKYYLVNKDLKEELPKIDPKVFNYLESEDHLKAELSSKAAEALKDLLVDKGQGNNNKKYLVEVPKRDLLPLFIKLRENKLKVELVYYQVDSRKMSIQAEDE